MQVGQIAIIVSRRRLGTFLCNTETNPKANVSAITLRNNKVYPKPPFPTGEQSSLDPLVKDLRAPPPPRIAPTKRIEPSPYINLEDSVTSPTPEPTPLAKPLIGHSINIIFSPSTRYQLKEYHPHVPYLSRLFKKKTDQQY